MWQSKGGLQIAGGVLLSQPVQRSTGESNWHRDPTRGHNTKIICINRGSGERETDLDYRVIVH